MVGSVPVLIIGWRRPDHARRVLEAVRRWQPTKLFLACDGFNPDSPPETIDGVLRTRAVFDEPLDWESDVQRRYADSNLGLWRAEQRAMDWFFEECEEGIILEDDCLPSPEFYPYCTELLDRYRSDERVLSISGDNSFGAVLSSDSSYGFVRYPLPWGWASWRRAWQHYDRDLDRFAALRETDGWDRLLPDPAERRVWSERLHSMRVSGIPDTWDHRWIIGAMMHGGLSILPRENLIMNIGYGAGATHTIGTSVRSNASTGQILPLRHPEDVVLDVEASRQVFDLALGGAEERLRFAWERSVRGRLRILFHRHIVQRLPREVVSFARSRFRFRLRP
jgi:hypothetical protein